MRVVVVALGKIGLPLAAFAALRGHEVVGVDIDAGVVGTVNAGREPFPGEAGLSAALAATVVGVAPGAGPAAGAGAGAPVPAATEASAPAPRGSAPGSVVVPGGTLVATTDVGAALAPGADLVLLVPPLVVDAAANPDWRALDAAVSAVGAALGASAAARGTGAGPDGDPPSVVVETTLPVGSTRGRVADLLARTSGLVPGRDLHVAHSPERVYSGRIFADLETYPKLVGGLDAEGERVTAGRYVRLLHGEAGGAGRVGAESSSAPPVEVRSLGGAEAAELTKLAETTYRDLNIAFANELAVHADRIGVDVAGVIDAANSQPFSHIHRPGVAVGGHCIPVYPRFYLAGDPDAALPAAARAVNEAMPAYAVGLLAEALATEGTPRGAGTLLGGARVLVLGAAYRGGVRETAFSGVFGLRDAIVAAGGSAVVADPLFDDDALRGLGLEPWDGGPVDGAVLQADHAEYRALAPGDLPGVRAVVDGRDVLDPAPWARAGIVVRRIGRDAAAPHDLP